MVSPAAPASRTLPADQLVAFLRALSDEIVAARQANDADFDPAPYLAQAAPLFGALHSVNRNSLLFAKQCRAKTQDARLDMDAAHLRLQVSPHLELRRRGLADNKSMLQNLLFERNHLEREIRSCEEYSSEYQNLPLHSLEELQELANAPEPPAGLKLPLPEGDTEESAHELMLTRLAFELAERKRFEEERKTLGMQKAKLVKENEVKKARLEDLEKQLTEFVEKARGIQAKMNEEPATA
ncbi:SPOSA6832_04860 [Sporobolomyces salmonicolor]|uniref:SPOSA6832_04860-mRNA-1:cds n=1 Tax=Sporidiobolus salmonicolor TaxID=5005 RepID=A0A0D6ESP5_SPOSA|nr:SPOSA6832_04860 [Sporobolomyces salmonicolor]